MDEVSIKQIFIGHGVRDFSDRAFIPGLTTLYEFGYIGYALQMSILLLIQCNGHSLGF
mgnify:CR=1 FL=1